MDPLSGFLDGPRARGAFLLRVVMRPPWSIAVADEAPLTLVQQVHGRSWFRPEGARPTALGPGDAVVVRSPVTYTLSTDVDAPPSIVIGPGQGCSGSDGRDLSEEMAAGVRTWGNDPDGEDCLLVGTYRSDGEVGRLLLRALPAYLVVRSPAPGVASLLQDELATAALGQDSMLDRLLDLLLIATLRAWATDPGTLHASGLLAAGQDPVVQASVRLLQERPGEPWTVEQLARTVGLSRPALARRFGEVVGVPPMAYLMQWRLALGADLLRGDDLTVGAIAHRVGYASPFSFSAAFKREYGVSPQAYRTGEDQPDVAAT